MRRHTFQHPESTVSSSLLCFWTFSSRLKQEKGNKTNKQKKKTTALTSTSTKTLGYNNMSHDMNKL